MPQNGYSIGRDTTIAVILPGGSSLNLGKVVKFSSKSDTTDQKIKGMDGITDHLRFYEGWSGSFELERMSPDLDTYFATLESNYYAGIAEFAVTIQQTVAEASGSVSQFSFQGALLKFDDAGDWSGDKAVSQKLSFVASRRIQQA